MRERSSHYPPFKGKEIDVKYLPEANTPCQVAEWGLELGSSESRSCMYDFLTLTKGFVRKGE